LEYLLSHPHHHKQQLYQPKLSPLQPKTRQSLFTTNINKEKRKLNLKASNGQELQQHSKLDLTKRILMTQPRSNNRLISI
jgi:hypothetical protein